MATQKTVSLASKQKATNKKTSNTVLNKSLLFDSKINEYKRIRDNTLEVINSKIRILKNLYELTEQYEYCYWATMHIDELAIFNISIVKYSQMLIMNCNEFMIFDQLAETIKNIVTGQEVGNFTQSELNILQYIIKQLEVIGFLQDIKIKSVDGIMEAINELRDIAYRIEEILFDNSKLLNVF